MVSAFSDGSSSCTMPPQAEYEVDIVIPVYNEGANIIATLNSLKAALQFGARILICYDHDNDNTLAALAGYDPAPLALERVRNRARGVIGAVTTGLAETTAPCVIVMPADDDYNAPRLNEMIRQHHNGYDIVVASRFMAGGHMEGGPPLKVMLVRIAAWFMRYIARAPTHDASNGFRLFSRRVIEQIPVESDRGFAYSIELLVKAHRLGWPITEVPVHWYERKAGQSRFRILAWLPLYLRWLLFALATTYIRRSPESVKLKAGEGGA
jgi:glycosyltransferase involved in cell wall biosynthesis